MTGVSHMKDFFKSHLSKWGVTAEFNISLKSDGWWGIDEYFEWFFRMDHNPELLLTKALPHGDANWDFIHDQWVKSLRGLTDAD